MLMSRGAGGWSQRKCTRKHPPGRKVYQRGAHTIWEVDGAKEKVRTHWSPSGRQFYFLTLGEQLYCQNLSLFGKLFIDIKTLFFDCDNCERSCRPQDVAYVPEQSCFISSPMLTPNGIMSSVSFQR
jgi:hypothetical protein